MGIFSKAETSKSIFNLSSDGGFESGAIPSNAIQAVNWTQTRSQDGTGCLQPVSTASLVN
jgi:hypothetical protein